MANSRFVKVIKIDDQGDRKLLYFEEIQSPYSYYIIAGKDDEIKLGDTVEYEPVGINFGWFKRVWR